MKIPFKKELPIIFVSSLAMTSPLYAEKQAIESIDHPTITIYQGGIALVAESREFQLSSADQQLFLPNVAPETVMESLMISFTPKEQSNPIPRITEKKLNRNLLSPSSLMDYSVGEDVKVITTINGREKVETAKILSNNGGVLLQYRDRIESTLPADARLSFTKIPQGLNTTPVLSVIMNNLPDSAADYRAHLNYLTHGISWNADYIAKLDDDANQLRLEGWATLNNNSGMDFKDFKINLVAGEVNLVRLASPRFKNEMRLMAADAAPSALGGNIMPNNLGDYHLYAIPNTSTLSDKEQTQIALFTEEGIPFNKNYTFENVSDSSRTSNSNQLQNANVSITFNNNKDSALGFPLPEGIIRLYQDRDNDIAFLGEDTILATPTKQEVVLNTGKAFDVTMKREQTKYAMINSDEWEVSYKIIVNNAKNSPVSTTVKESFYPGYNTNWALIQQSPDAKIVNDTAVWNLDIPAKSSKVLSYTVRYTIFKEDSKNDGRRDEVVIGEVNSPKPQ